MTITRLNERALLALGMDRVTVRALQHGLDQTGSEVGALTLPAVAAQVASILALTNYRATLIADAVASNTAANITLVTLTIPIALSAGAQISGRIVGVTSNGATPGTLNLWLSANGVKVFTHAIATTTTPGGDKGFTADFTIAMRTATAAQIGGLLATVAGVPSLFPTTNFVTVTFPNPLTLALGMNWTAAAASNSATVKLAHLAVERL